MRHLLFVVATGAWILIISSCQSTVKTLAQEKPAGNIILLIGDGMGVTQVSSVFFYRDDTTNFIRFPYVGLHNPVPAGAKITDSAAGATAFSTGEKTYNGAISVTKDTVPARTILEVLSDRGWNAGIVSTSAITHATPACFYAHAKSREMQEEIAEQLCYSPVDFFAGGGTQFFVRRKDGRNLLDTLRKTGFVVDTAALPDRVSPQQKFGLVLANDGMPRLKERGEFLSEATAKALTYLSRREEGFFLLIEGSQIDWGGHAKNARYVIEEMLDFDKAVGLAMDFAEKDKNTLVVVTGDHETGGFALAPAEIFGQRDYSIINPAFSTGGHTAALIPVFAYGPGANRFTGIYPNNAIFSKVMAAAGR